MATLYGMRLLAPEKVPQEVQGMVFLNVERSEVTPLNNDGHYYIEK